MRDLEAAATGAGQLAALQAAAEAARVPTAARTDSDRARTHAVGNNMRWGGVHAEQTRNDGSSAAGSGTDTPIALRRCCRPCHR